RRRPEPPAVAVDALVEAKGRGVEAVGDASGEGESMAGVRELFDGSNVEAKGVDLRDRRAGLDEPSLPWRKDGDVPVRLSPGSLLPDHVGFEGARPGPRPRRPHARV